MLSRLLAKPLAWIVVIPLCLGVAGALYWFQPWRLVTGTTVTDSLAVVPADAPSTPAAASASAPAASAPAVAVVLSEGAFVSHEHDTEGKARVVRNPDGSHQLELVGLDTSDGPDLRVWLTDQPVLDGRDGWHVFDDGVHRELGRLKGNQGDQVYRLGAGIDPADFRSVTVWCKRFSVSFGAAPLT